MIDLAKEIAALRSIDGRPRERLRDAGVSLSVFALYQLIGWDRVRVENDIYCPDPEGRPAFITPIRVDPDAPWDGLEAAHPELAILLGDPVDCIAWHPDTPNNWASRVGVATWAGTIRPQSCDPPTVPIFRTPLNWFRAGAVGLVPLSRDRGDIQRLLQRIVAIEAEDEGHVRQLRQIASRPVLAPTITARRQPIRRAA